MSDHVDFQPAGALPAETPKDLGTVAHVACANPGDRKTIEATVFAVIPEYHQVCVKSSDGYHYAITKQTPGIDWTILREGQRLECIVTTALPRVLAAHILA